MRIAQIAPLAESVPPKLYGGTERIVSFLTEELVSLGHEVTLFASGDSITSAELVPCSDMALRLDGGVLDCLPYHLLMLEKLRQRAREFDLVHFHIDLFQFPFLRTMNIPALTTLHGRLDLPDLQPFYKTFPDAQLVSISDDQRKPMPPVNWLKTIHHGIPADLLPFSPEPKEGGYLAFLGRISPEKRPDRAIEIATRLQRKLKIAAKVDKADQKYWNDVIEPMTRDNPFVEFIGEIGDAQKPEFLGNAAALLFPIDWPEPFGLVMIEAMACGTPVIAFRCGSVPEIMEDGVTGWIVGSVDEAVERLRNGPALARDRVRAAFDARFTARRMALDYVNLYEHLVEAHAPLMSLPRRASKSERAALDLVRSDSEYLPDSLRVGDRAPSGDCVAAAIRDIDRAAASLHELA